MIMQFDNNTIICHFNINRIFINVDTDHFVRKSSNTTLVFVIGILCNLFCKNNILYNNNNKICTYFTILSYGLYLENINTHSCIPFAE